MIEIQTYFPKETILDIQEVEKYKKTEKDGSYDYFDGYIIKTSKQEIKFLIEQGTYCCERYGYFSTEDNLKDFIGKELLGIDIVDRCYNKKKLEEDLELLEEDAIFLDIKTPEGIFQLVVYNQHNGYYGHNIVIQSEKLNEELVI